MLLGAFLCVRLVCAAWLQHLVLSAGKKGSARLYVLKIFFSRASRARTVLRSGTVGWRFLPLVGAWVGDFVGLARAP